MANWKAPLLKLGVVALGVGSESLKVKRRKPSFCRAASAI
jgi:hypothetical protein